MSLEERVEAVERALTDDDVAPASLSDAAAVERRLDDLEERQEDLEGRLAALEAAVEALRGRVGEDDRAVREMERTAERALATARETRDRLESEAPPPEIRRIAVDRSDDGDGTTDGEGNDLVDRLRDRW